MSQHPVMIDEVCGRTPENIEAEQSLLGSVMISANAFDTAKDFIHNPDKDFYRSSHVEIWKAIEACIDRDGMTDVVTLSEELQRRDMLDAIGGKGYLFTLVESVPTATNVAYYAKIVADKSARRRGISRMMQAIAELKDETADVEEVMSSAQSGIDEIMRDGEGANTTLMSDVYRRVHAEIREKKKPYGLPIKLQSLREICVAMYPGDMIITGGRPGTGKSALVFDMLNYCAQAGEPAAFFSLEMTESAMAMREIARSSGINLYNVFNGTLVDYHHGLIEKAVEELVKPQVYFVDAQGWSMSRIKAAARRLVAQGVKIIAIDHLQLVRPQDSRANRKDQLGQISGDCKNLAKQLRIPILALCQLSRAVDKKGANARPQMADLKESGDIEANADAVWLLWRKMPKEGEPQEKVTEAEIIVAKNRMLPTGIAKCGWFGRKFSFVDVVQQRKDDTE